MIEVIVEDDSWLEAEPQAEALAQKAGAATIDGDASVLLTSDARLRELNKAFRGKDAPTNVLSFPAGGMAGEHLGDIALGFGVCAREAAEQGKSLAAHLQHLVAHGALHLVGYDHEDEAEAGVMEAREREILAGLGVSDPYA